MYSAESVIDFVSENEYRLSKQLEFWFSKKPQGFFKFIEPCEHKLYRPKDSWTEELSVTANTFRKYLKKVCTTYKSKQAFSSSTDPFMGKRYASYYDRIRKVMFFFQNPKAIEEVIEPNKNSHLPKKCVSDCVSDCVSVNSNNSLNKKHPPKSPRVDSQKKDVGNLIINEISKADGIDPIASQMHELWIKHTKNQIPTPKLTPRFAKVLVTFLNKNLQGSLESWDLYCLKIASSKFLMGQTGNFKAWLVWSIKESVFEKIRAGEYGVDSTIQLKTKEQEKGVLEARATDSIKLSNESDFIKMVRSKLLSIVGPAIYCSWFQTLKLEPKGQGEAVFSASQFVTDYIQNNFRDTLNRLGLNPV